MTSLYTRVHPGQTWKSPGRADLPGQSVPEIILGVTTLTAENIGAGILRPRPTETISSAVTYSTSQVIRDKVFDNLITVNNGAVVTFENCIIRGPAVRTSGSNLVTTTNASLVTLSYCDVSPQTPSVYWNAIGYSNYRVEYCNVWGTVDCFAAFALSGAANRSVNVKIIGTWAHDLSQFKPDIDRPVTHNDILQAQGNLGPEDDILIDGCRFDAYHSVELSSPTPPEHTEISAVMLTPNTTVTAGVYNPVCITVRRTRFTGGNYCINGASARLTADSRIVITDNVFENNHPSSGGPSTAIALRSTATNRDVARNFYESGAAVSIYAV